MKRVLFVCVESAGRSQMAEAFAKRHGNARARLFLRKKEGNCGRCLHC